MSKCRKTTVDWSELLYFDYFFLVWHVFSDRIFFTTCKIDYSKFGHKNHTVFHLLLHENLENWMASWGLTIQRSGASSPLIKTHVQIIFCFFKSADLDSAQISYIKIPVSLLPQLQTFSRALLNNHPVHLKKTKWCISCRGFSSARASLLFIVCIIQKIKDLLIVDLKEAERILSLGIVWMSIEYVLKSSWQDSCATHLFLDFQLRHGWIPTYNTIGFTGSSLSVSKHGGVHSKNEGMHCGLQFVKDLFLPHILIEHSVKFEIQLVKVFE